MATVSIRYIVDDVDAAIPFYCEQLGFELVMHPAPPFAMLKRGDLRLVLSAPNAGPGGGQSLPDGTRPAPGGWNRFAIEVDDIDDTVRSLLYAGVRFRGEIVDGDRRPADDRRGPLRQPDRAVPADADGSAARLAVRSGRSRSGTRPRAPDRDAAYGDAAFASNGCGTPIRPSDQATYKRPPAM